MKPKPTNERLLADREKAASATAIVEAAGREAAALQAQLAAAPEVESLAEAEGVRAVARLQAALTVRVAREQAFGSVLDRVRETLAALRGSAAYPAVFRALLDESRTALPDARELRVDRHDADLATSMAGGLQVVAVLDTWGGVELAGDDGRTVRNTLEERLANADLATAWTVRAVAARRLTDRTGGRLMMEIRHADFDYGNTRLHAPQGWTARQRRLRTPPRQGHRRCAHRARGHAVRAARRGNRASRRTPAPAPGDPVPAGGLAGGDALLLLRARPEPGRCPALPFRHTKRHLGAARAGAPADGGRRRTGRVRPGRMARRTARQRDSAPAGTRGRRQPARSADARS